MVDETLFKSFKDFKAHYIRKYSDNQILDMVENHYHQLQPGHLKFVEGLLQRCKQSSSLFDKEQWYKQAMSMISGVKTLVEKKGWLSILEVQLDLRDARQCSSADLLKHMADNGVLLDYAAAVKERPDIVDLLKSKHHKQSDNDAEVSKHHKQSDNDAAVSMHKSDNEAEVSKHHKQSDNDAAVSMHKSDNDAEVSIHHKQSDNDAAVAMHKSDNDAAVSTRKRSAPEALGSSPKKAKKYNNVFQQKADVILYGDDVCVYDRFGARQVVSNARYASRINPKKYGSFDRHIQDFGHKVAEIINPEAHQDRLCTEDEVESVKNLIDRLLDVYPASPAVKKVIRGAFEEFYKASPAEQRSLFNKRNATFESVKNDNRILQQKINVAEGKVSIAEGKVSILTADIGQLTADNGQLKQKVLDLTADYGQLKQENLDLKQRLEATEADLILFKIEHGIED